MSSKDVQRYVEDLLAGRTPRGFEPDDEDMAEIRAAIALRAARPGAGMPEEDFVSGLRERLADDLDEPATEHGGHTRRTLLIGSSVAAAAAAAGAVVDRTLLDTGPTDPPTAAPQTIEPTTGTWHAVLASAELPDGGAAAFDLGAVNGFLRRAGGVVYALSGVCTHQGCKLWLDSAADRLRCPCHATSFGLDGDVTTHALPRAPDPLPRLRVREADGSIEVFAPDKPA